LGYPIGKIWNGFGIGFGTIGYRSWKALDNLLDRLGKFEIVLEYIREAFGIVMDDVGDFLISCRSNSCIFRHRVTRFGGRYGVILGSFGNAFGRFNIIFGSIQCSPVS